MALVSFLQNQFTALNRQVDPANLPPGSYAILTNGRIRNGSIKPISLPLDITAQLPPIKNAQGMYGFDNFLVVFGDGKAWIRNYDISSTTFVQVPGFLMSSTVDIIYALEVPASTINYARKLTTTAVNGGVTLTTAIQGSPAAIICQDGINQPFVILPTGVARVTQNYSQWTTSNREYVPIGTIMIYINDKVYLMMEDSNGNLTLIASSVSGRPLDFMVNIDTNGNAGGDATTTAYSVDYNPITCMSVVASAPSVNGQGSSFFVSTQKCSYLVNPNYNTTYFGEPTYSNQVLFTQGPTNNFSLCDLIGNQALIYDNGIISFNAVLSTRFEGRASPFSQTIAPIFGDVDDINNSIVQTTTAAYSWCDYSLFAVTTIYGQAIMVYDTLFQSFVSIDIFSNVTAPIKMFADIKTTTGIRELFFITEDNHTFQYLAGETSTCGAYLGDYTPTGQGIDLKPMFFNPTFVNVIQSGTLTAQIYVDGKALGEPLVKPITADPDAIAQPQYPLSLPFGTNDADLTRTPNFDVSQFEQGCKWGVWLTWDFKGQLLMAQSAADARTPFNSLKQQARDYATYNETLADNAQIN